MRRIGIIGSGPMAGYSLRQLITSQTPLSITIFEADAVAGCGMPYRAGINADEMYCNAFSKEIPIYTQRLAFWLKDQPDSFLHRWGLAQEDINSRSFYPRVLLGEYLQAEFYALCAKGRDGAHSITVLTGHRVNDIEPNDTAVHCIGANNDGHFKLAFDDIIIATGHDWPSVPKIDGVELVSPWPYSNVTQLSPKRIGILGSSLSAIDVLVALGLAHGEFHESNGRTSWFVADGAEDLKITMISRNEIMPEPDFFYPYPFEPLTHITPEAVRLEIEKGSDDLLARVFALLVKELRATDPAYFSALGSQADSIEGFCAAYVKQRKELGGLRALRESLKVAVQTFDDRTTQGYRCTLLHGHENFEPLLDHLNEEDMKTFHDHLAPVFGDCYAAIPHISVERVLALYDAGVLDLVATQEGGKFSREKDAVAVDTVDGIQCFDVIVDARGQPSASLKDLKFATLSAQLPKNMIGISAPYRLPLATASTSRVYCLAMPQILSVNPFAQGLANCAALSKVAVDDILLHLEVSAAIPRVA
ncbi:FAD/NAD(P)-binding protein [Sulfitobacter guttiformis]|uniref:Putative NAD(P)/FAD-binding protein YdhS n=1 Tax=Sulfitobacter guttiformis TaxID=74349 RepID=A0A420DHS7_9RHOB|nr:FAD/NAD(P)-binding protein [Sulfitobacter guttiformis]KIN72495.1 Pyridine nucleotide-disulfide oxidoreductase [Sulfitobacter guttiformis KCTC 32187]RKE93755.1 putative NAD(P)/FAD-binding protein YdhS [Sulfitobacter guttiformis]